LLIAAARVIAIATAVEKLKSITTLCTIPLIVIPSLLAIIATAACLETLGRRN
jgi:hypothetical protein